MQIILLEKIGRLGILGDVVEVKNGYARNYLLPKGKALMATESNLSEFTKVRAEAERENKANMEEAQGWVSKIADSSFVFISQSGDDGRLYGSIGAKEIVSRIEKEYSYKISPSCVKLGAKVKDLGIYDILIELHPEVSVHISINVARSEEEAKVALEKKAKESLAEAKAKERAKEKESRAIEMAEVVVDAEPSITEGKEAQTQEKVAKAKEESVKANGTKTKDSEAEEELKV